MLLSVFALVVGCLGASAATIERWQTLARESPQKFAAELQHAFPFGTVRAGIVNGTAPLGSLDSSALPTVSAHGMGDSCFNPGMKEITTAVGKHVGSYAVCIPTGNNTIEDTLNGFLMTMDKNVDVFAAKVRADPKLKHGFNAMGFSQGNSVIRGYIQKYNDPPVATFLSVHGTVMGTSSFPQCNPDGSKLCTDLAELLGDLAYNELVQNILFQANYFRDPQLESSSAYLRTSQIAAWNNATRTAPSVWRSNFAKTKKFAMIKALKDTMIFPNEGEWWGQFAPGSFNKVQAMKDTPDYLSDSFGLRTADEAGKLSFETTAGNHLQFTEEQLMGWVDKYFSKSF